MGVSLRCSSPAWRNPISVAWIYPTPGHAAWGPTRDFSFGRTHWDDNHQPSELLQVTTWVSRFAEDEFATFGENIDITCYSLSYQDAVANIDLLAERVAKVIRELKQLNRASA